MQENRSFTPDERRLLNQYMRQYDTTQNQISRLLDSLEIINNNISNVIYLSSNNVNNGNSNNINPSLFNNSFSNSNFNSNNFRNNYNPDFSHARNSRTSGNPGRNRRVSLDYTQPATNTTNATNATSTTARVYYDYSTPIETSTYENTLGSSITNLLQTFLDTPITVRPTAQQISNACIDISYSLITDPCSNDCPISLDTFTDLDTVTQIKQCKHIFKPQSLSTWFETNTRCPVCRYDIRNYVEPITPDNNISTESNLETGNNETISPTRQSVLRNELRNFINRTSDANLVPINSSGMTTSNNRTYYDSSNNVFYFETILR